MEDGEGRDGRGGGLRLLPVLGAGRQPPDGHAGPAGLLSPAPPGHTELEIAAAREHWSVSAGPHLLLTAL